MGKINQCDICAYYDYNESRGTYECVLILDQDETERLYGMRRNDCPYFHIYDEYKMVQKQN